jgi:hypothetical protein
MPKFPFGDKGPCEIIWNYGESGALSLGDFFGQVIFNMANEFSPIETEAQGNAMVDAVFLGASATLDVPMTRSPLEALEDVLMAVDIGDDIIHVKNPAGCSLYDLARQIVIKPLCNGVADVDPANWILIYKACPVPSANLPFDRSTQRTFPIKFLCFVSQESGDEGRIYDIGMPSGSTEFGV